MTAGSSYHVLLTLMAAACVDSSARQTAAYEQSDSAGVTIVASARPLDPNALEVDTGAMLVFGDIDGDADYLFERVVGGAVLGDGRIVVLEARAAQLKFYDAQGRFLGRAAGQGDGPGEMRAPAHLLKLPGDTLVVWERGFRPVSIFTGEGDFVRRETIDGDRIMHFVGRSRATEAFTPLADGSLVLHVTERGRTAADDGEVYRSRVGFYRLHGDTGRIDSLAWYDAGVTLISLAGGGRERSGLTLSPASGQVATAVDPVRVFYGDGETWRIDVYDAAGRLSRLIRPDVPLVPISDSARAALEREYIDMRGPGNRAEQQRLLAALPHQAHYPAFRHLIVDSRGWLWAESRAGHEVFDRDGRWMTTVHLPGRALEIGDDHVLVLLRDELMVERIARLKLQRHPIESTTAAP